MLQFLPKSVDRARQADLDPGDAPPGTEPHMIDEDEAWVEGRSLVATVNDIELIDPAVSSERLAYNLFHEHGVRVFRAAPVQAPGPAHQVCERQYRHRVGERVGPRLATGAPRRQHAPGDAGEVTGQPHR